MEPAESKAARLAMNYLAEQGCPPSCAKVLVMGTNCKGTCRPQSHCTIRSLRSAGVLVDFYDPGLAEARCGGLRARGVSSLSPAELGRYNMVILQQPCSEEDYRRASVSARCLLDMRRPAKDCII